MITCPKIVFIATHWGAKHGGINCFNRDICCAFVKVLQARYDVICVVPDASGLEIQEAKEKNVTLCKVPTNTPNLDNDWVDLVLKRLKNHEIYCWIGHDVKTGFTAYSAAKAHGQSTSAVIHHMDYEAYGTHNPDMVAQQRNVLMNCDKVFSVGPLLEISARDKTGHQKDIVMIVPGLAEIKGLPPPERFSAITFGRLDAKSNRVKQGDLAIASYALAYERILHSYPSPSFITVIGLSEEGDNITELQRLHGIAKEYTERTIQINAWPYIEDREKLFDSLRHHSVAMMLSIHEGFGLVGWEAISAEVPLIVSKRSGLYAFINKFLGGEGRGCLRPVDIRGTLESVTFQKTDIDAVAEQLIDVYNNPEAAKQDAIHLKQAVSKIFSWEYTAKKMVQSLGIDIDPPTFSHKTKKDLAELLGVSSKDVSLMIDEISDFYRIRNEDRYATSP